MTTEGTFVVRVTDLEAGPLRLRLPITKAWLEQALSETEARPWLAQDGGEDEGRLAVDVALSGRNVLVRGNLAVAVTLPCARTLDPANYRLEPEIFLMLAPAGHALVGHAPGGQAGRGHAGPHVAGAHGRQPKAEPVRADGKRKGRNKDAVQEAAPPAKGGKKKGGGDWSEDPELLEEDAAQDTYSGEQIVLDDFVREFILLELPMFPVREDLRSESFEGSSAPPDGAQATGAPPEMGERPLDPRLSPLADLKARLDERARLEKKE